MWTPAHAAAGEVSTDRDGRYCIVWAKEDLDPVARVESSEIAIGESWRALNGASSSAGCQPGDQGIPWNRADDLKSSPQFVAVPVLAMSSVVLLMFAIFLGGGQTLRHPRIAGLSLTVASTLLAALLWLL